MAGKLCLLLDQLGKSVDWDDETANVYDGLKEEMAVWADEGVAKVDWHPINLRFCQRGQWNERMVVEAVLSRLTWVYFQVVDAPSLARLWQTRVGFAMALFNLWIQWGGLSPDVDGFVPCSIAQFGL